jgi:membrane-associated phospholipid phosphatase
MWHWQFITRFGETSLLFPAAALFFAWLIHCGELANARKWMATFGAAAAVALVSKLAFMGWGVGIAELDFTGFSGHSMMATAVLPVLFFRLAPTHRPRVALLAAAAGVVLALSVGLSRLALHAHSLSEVVGGLALGLAASLAFIGWSSARDQHQASTLASVLVAALLVAVPASGMRAPTHHWLERIAVCLSGRDKPFRRSDLLLLGAVERMPGDAIAGVHAVTPASPGNACPMPRRVQGSDRADRADRAISARPASQPA